MRTEPDQGPLDVIAGWAATLLTGILLSAYIGGVSWDVAYGLLSERSQDLWLAPVNAAEGLILTAPIAFVVGIVPITLTYLLMRRLARRVPVSIASRLVFGLAAGTFWNAILLFVDSPRNYRTGITGIAAVWPTYFPYLQIELAALAVSLAVRPRWLGVA